MADISKIQIESGTYDIKDETSRNLINGIIRGTENRKFLFVGDSYGTGYTPDGNINGWPIVLSNLLGLTSTQYTIAVSNGYGFITSGYEFYNLINSLSNDSAITDVIILGGYNDRSGSFSTIKQAITNCKTLINTKFNNPRIHIGQIGTSGTASNTYLLNNVTNSYKTACRELNINYIDNIQYALRSYFTMFSSDGFHPNTTGQMSIACYLRDYLMNGHIDVILSYIDYNADSETNYTIPDNLPTSMTMNLVNDKTFLSLKSRISITIDDITMNANNTWYKMGTTKRGYIVGSQYRINNVVVPIVIKSNNLYYVTNAMLNFDNGFNICLYGVNDQNSNFGSFTHVTEILIPPFSVVFDSGMC